MLRFFRLAAVLALTAGTGAGTVLARGNLVLNGGGGRPREVMEKFIELAGGREAAIVIVPTASAEADTGSYYVGQFADVYGCTDVTALEIHSREDAARADYAELARGAGGIFFTGGDQRRIIEALQGTPTGEAIAAAFAAGAAVGGSSAGTACQSPLMITGEGDFEVIEGGNVELWHGLGLFPGVIVDQHFIARKRENRLFSVVLEHPELLGVGVDEATAVWVKPDDTFEVLGNGWVMVIDASHAAVTRSVAEDGSAHLGGSNLKVHILQPGDVYDLGIRAVVPRR